MEIKVFDTKDALDQSVNIPLATGASRFEILSHLARADGVGWPAVTCLRFDEYVGMPITHKASFRRHLRERFIDQLAASPAAFHYINASELLRVPPP